MTTTNQIRAELEQAQTLSDEAAYRSLTPKLAEAVRAILTIHQRTEHERAYGLPREDKWEHYCLADDESWPCPTVQALLHTWRGQGDE